MYERENMQKIFRKYTFIIITFAILSILVINFWFAMHSLKSQQFKTFCTKIDQVIHTMENNQNELGVIMTNLDEDYLTRAKAAAYVLEQNDEAMQSVEELQQLAVLLDVDELHIIDERGIIVCSSIQQYIGIDMHDGEQTREFLQLLEGDGDEEYIIQDSQPNMTEGRIMKYVGVCRKGKKGIIQVGLEPIRQMEAQVKNTYDYIFSIFPTDIGEEYFTVECGTGLITTYSEGLRKMSKNTDYETDRLRQCEKGGFLRMKDGIARYVVTRQYEDVLIGVAVPREILFRNLWRNLLNTLVCLLFMEAVIIVLLNYLVKRKVVDGIHDILLALGRITEGNLDTAVAVRGNQELEELSRGINAMVKSIVHTSDRIARIIDMSEIPLAVFEYTSDMKQVFITSGLKEMFELSAEQMAELCSDTESFYHKIQKIMGEPVEGEKDTYRISDSKYIRMHLSLEGEEYLGVVTDVTKDVLEKQQIQYDNNHDQLTGLKRYRYFKSCAAEILANMPPGKICAMVMIDLDAFKSINDTFGHDIGDIYLQSFAGMLKELPENHCMTARRSGDEFCIMAYNYQDREGIVRLLSMFWSSLEKKKVKLSEQYTKTICASGGFAWTGHAEMDIDLLLNQADEALYKSKNEQKGYFTEYISK